ncbi:uncharacterized protein N7458_005967 [Penicillium daleae]|uniref:Uncharacterized protein n=1 Tax=Penicillium daleae TaxID=63821 RepID=A0AAD6C4I2_9EURO|nr:uncharacterized protein N7458_005953 [Penicillium daleae]XP_056765053.1 uncharacterized protein N7458_005967 [Penicillium daleae]KAJ5449504.1 hypothetical protein N7458_005953 [Penicillium daleae]KAJ5449518.1 hypothetical protein N7458_005967 [Penicillium daleae]
MTSVPTPPQGLVFTSVSTSYHRLASEKASSRTLQAYFARLSCTHLSSRLPPSERWLIQVKILPNTRETEEAPSENPSGSGSDFTPSTTSPEGLPSTTEFNNTQDQESIATSPPDPSPLGATPSTDPLTQSLITLETHQKFPGSLPDDRIALTSQVDFGIERFLPATTGSNNPPSDNIIGDLEPTERAQASLIRTSAEGGIQPGHFSHEQVESQNAPQEDTTQGASGPQSSTTLVIISSLSSTTSFVFSTPTTELDWSGVSRRPSKQSLAAIFGSYVIGTAETLESESMPCIAHITAAMKASV